MKQLLAVEIMMAGHSVFLTGPAGAGKTYVLNQFIKLAKHDGRFVSVTATTGLAATHLGGTTIHSWSGIGVADSLHDKFVESMSKGRREIIEKTDTLIIDEISMLHDYRLDMIDGICREVRNESDIPFGGIQVIMSGDFFQLPPVNRGDSRAGGFVVHSDAWRGLDPVVCYLDEQHRQEDNALLDILSAFRSGDVRRHHAESLLERVDIHPQEDHDLTELHTVNIDVDAINEVRLKQLSGDEVSYTQTSTGGENYVENLQRSVLAPKVLSLKIGALVMTVKNSVEKKYVNGSIGTVVEFERGSDYPVVEFRSGQVQTIEPDTWELRDGDKKRASITQIPLRLAWAITVHKSQGMTLDAARIDLRKAFVPGMGYVALSRVKRMDTLYLHGINQMALKVSEDALSIDVMLRRNSVEASEEYKELELNADSRKKVLLKDSKKTGWSEKITEMRKIYPNAYKPWVAQDDALLSQEFQNGKSVGELSKMFGRHEGSIIMRLQKHFGEDVIG